MRGRTAWGLIAGAAAMNQAAGDAGRLTGGAATRRQALAALAAAGGLVAMPALARPAARPPRRIAIVGGGLAGMSALERLLAAGADATLYEARAQAGGRVRTLRGVFGPGSAVDEGAQLVNSDHVRVRALVRRLGLRLVDRFADGPERVSVLVGGRVVPEAELADALRPLAARVAGDAAAVERDPAGAGARLDRLSVDQYLSAAGLPPGPARSAVEAGIRTEYGSEPAEVSALLLLFNLPKVEGGRVELLGASDERYLVEGGCGGIAERLAARLAARVRLNARLESLAVEPSGRARLGFADGSTAEADRVILALPAGLYRSLRIDAPLPGPWPEALAQARLGANEKLVAMARPRPWDLALGRAGALWADGPMAAAWDGHSGRPLAGEGPFTFFLGGAQVAAMAEGPASVRAAGAAQAAEPAVPGLAEAVAAGGTARRTAWTRDPLAQGAYSTFAPGQLSRWAPLLSGPSAGRAGPLLFAGEWLSADWTGYMEGAIETGQRAALAALRAMAA
jgi:monoamine oxidase